jgi:hypothetical protein
VDISSTLLHTLADRPDAVANLEADVPEEGNQALHIAAAMGVRRFRHQQHDVDIGAGVQFAAPITSDRNQSPRLDVDEMLSPPCFAKHNVDEGSPRVDEILNRIFRQKTGFQLFMSLP